MRKPLKIIFLVLVLFLTAFLVTNPDQAMEAAASAAELCLDTVIPSLFPFFVCSGLLCSLGFSSLCTKALSPLMRPLFNLPGAGALAFVLGITSGYPIGAATAADLYATGQCTKTEAERMLAFCNNSGPLFVMGVVGSGYLESPALGRYLYLSHVVSAILVGMLFRFLGSSDISSHALPPSMTPNKKTALFSLGGVVDSSVSSMLKVCGFIIFFAVVSRALPHHPFVYSLTEITGGLRELSLSEGAWTLPLMSFFLAISGLSVLFQVSAITSPHGLSLKPYIFGKLIQGAFSFFITLALLKIFPPAHEAFAPDSLNLAEKLSPLTLVLSSVAATLATVTALICLMLFQGMRKE